jgi:hypothetical protein
MLSGGGKMGKEWARKNLVHQAARGALIEIEVTARFTNYLHVSEG